MPDRVIYISKTRGVNGRFLLVFVTILAIDSEKPFGTDWHRQPCAIAIMLLHICFVMYRVAR